MYISRQIISKLWSIKGKAEAKMLRGLIYCRGIVWDLKEHTISLALMCIIDTMSRFKERYKVFWITTM